MIRAGWTNKAAFGLVAGLTEGEPSKHQRIQLSNKDVIYSGLFCSPDFP